MTSDLFDRRPLLIVGLFVLLVFWNLVFRTDFTFLEYGDLVFQVLPWYQVQARAWHDGLFPLWDPYQWGGQSLIGQMQPGAAFPLNWPLLLMPLKDGYVDLRFVHWHYVAMHLLAALFMYALARELGRSRYASIIAALAFACGGYVGNIQWPQMLHGAIWIPLIFLLFHRIAAVGWGLRALMFAGLCGAAVGLSGLSGHHQTPMYTVLALAGLSLYFLFERKRDSGRQAWRFAGVCAVVALFAFLVAALQLLPAIEYGRQAYRWVEAVDPITFQDPVPYYVHSKYRLPTAGLLGLIIPEASFEVKTFVGFFCLSMALYAVALCWKDRWVRVYSCIVLAAVAYALGPFSLLHGWIYGLVPFADKARSPAHAVFVFQFALFVVAAHGVDRLFRREEGAGSSNQWLVYIQRALLAFGFIAVALVFFLQPQPQTDAGTSDRFMLAALVAFLLGALLHGYRKGLLSPTTVRLSFLLLMLFEMSTTRWFHVVHRSDPERANLLPMLSEYKGVTDFLKSQPQPFRFEIRAQDKPNLGDWEGLEDVHGYLASVSSDLFDFFGRDWARAQLLMNTVYVVSKQKVRDEQVEVYSDPSGWKVFRNPDAYPRAWVEHHLEHIDLPDGHEGRLSQPEVCEGDGEVVFERLSIHQANARVQMACRGYVIFGEPYFPGWKSFLDGQEVPTYRAYGALRALAVPAGEHEIEFRYRPSSVYVGGVLTASGLLGCLLLAAIVQRKSRKY